MENKQLTVLPQILGYQYGTNLHLVRRRIVSCPSGVILSDVRGGRSLVSAPFMSGLIQRVELTPGHLDII